MSSTLLLRAGLWHSSELYGPLQVLPLALMEQTYAQMNVAHDDVPDDTKVAMTGLERSRLYWSPQGNEDEYEPGTKATAQHWSFSRTGQRGALDAPDVESLLEFDRFADRLYGAQDRLADAVMAGVAAGLGLPLDEFSRHVRNGHACVACLSTLLIASAPLNAT